MLQTVKQEIDNQTEEEFPDYYMRFICEMQDESIQLELDSVRRNNNLNSRAIDRLISHTYERIIHK